MSLEAARKLSVLELLRVLDEKLDLEFTRVRETCLHRAPAAFLEAEVEGLEAGVHDIFKLIPSLQHSLRPENRLLPEIISRIARCLLDEDHIDARAIIPLTHVCRHWRKSIILTPEHWTSISNERVGLAELSLERSGSALLNMRLDMRQVEDNPGFYDLLASHIGRTETLSIDFVPSTRGLVQTLWSFPEPMTRLRSLSLSGHASLIDPFAKFAPYLTHLLSFRRLKTLTDLTICNHRFDLHIDTLLDFLEANSSLERVTLEIQFIQSSLRVSRRRRIVTGMNRLRYLSMRCSDAMDTKALISKMALRKGAHLEIACRDKNARLCNVLLGITAAQLPNLLSTFVEYRPRGRSIRLLGPDGSFSFENPPSLDLPLMEFLVLPPTKVQEFHLRHRRTSEGSAPPAPFTFIPSFFPALKALVVDCETDVSTLFSAFFSKPSDPPSLETLTFLDCDLTDGFMRKLTQYASNRMNTTSALLRRVDIADSKGNLPSAARIDALRKHVPVVRAQKGNELPTILT